MIGTSKKAWNSCAAPRKSERKQMSKSVMWQLAVFVVVLFHGGPKRRARRGPPDSVEYAERRSLRGSKNRDFAAMHRAGVIILFLFAGQMGPLAVVSVLSRPTRDEGLNLREAHPLIGGRRNPLPCPALRTYLTIGSSQCCRQDRDYFGSRSAKRLISATATPLASIFWSGSLAIVPILNSAVGPYSVYAMAAVCGTSY